MKEFKYSGKNESDRHPVPGTKGAAESFFLPEETAHARRDPWVAPDWMMESIYCPFCNKVTPYSHQATCPSCHILMCKECLLSTPLCDDCGAPWPGTDDEIIHISTCCPYCYKEGRCSCGNKVAERYILRPLDKLPKVNEDVRRFIDERLRQEKIRREEEDLAEYCRRFDVERLNKTVDPELEWREYFAQQEETEKENEEKVWEDE